MPVGREAYSEANVLQGRGAPLMLSRQVIKDRYADVLDAIDAAPR